MEIQNNSNETQYTNKLSDIEAQITEEDKRILVKSESIVSDVCCAKMCIASFTTALLSPFAVCDVYYASTDHSCVTQGQSDHHLEIILQSYLMASGIIMFVIIGLFNFTFFALDVNLLSQNKNDNDFSLCVSICSWVFRSFDLAWLILGCVLFWGYTDISNCSQSVHDYLFARFILGIVSFVSRIQQENSNSNK